MLLGEWARRVWYLLNRSRRERELELEMAAHRELMGDRRAFGNLLKLREDARDAWGWTWLDRTWQDARHAGRMLRRAPGFTLAATSILSAGIGLNLALFHMFNVAVLQPPAIEDPATLVRFMRQAPTFTSTGLPYPATEFIAAHNSVLSAVLTRIQTHVSWADNPEDRLRAAFVSPNWFSELGYDAAAFGRVLTETHDAPADAPPVVIVSHEFWRSRLHGAPDVAGRTVRINGRPTTIVGVAPARFPGLELRDPQVWLPIQHVDYFLPGIVVKEGWRSHNTEMYARLRPGVSAAAAADALRPTLQALARVRPDDFHVDERLEPATGDVHFRFAPDRRELFAVASLAGALTLLVLVVASANLGNLVLSRAIDRLRELSLRVALGASRGRILRHLLVEAAALATLGAAGGIVLGTWGAQVLARYLEFPAYLDLAPDWTLVAVGYGVALVALLAFGAIPAWIVSRRELSSAIKDGGQQMSAGLSRARFRTVLVAAQVAGCCVLLVVAGAMTRGLLRLLSSDLGFAYERVAVVEASLERTGLRGAAARAYWDRVAETLAAQPEVDGLALMTPAPLGDMMAVSGYDRAPGLEVSVVQVQPQFFTLMDIPLLAGRSFGPADGPGQAVIISRRLALAMYGSLDVVGKPFPLPDGKTSIVGVVGDAPVVRVRAAGVAEQYEPLDPERADDLVLIARARAHPEVLLPPMRQAVRAADDRMTPRTRLLRDDYEKQLRGPRLASLVAGMISLLVLTLASLGIFGVVAYAVAMRTKEIGIRRALGASDHAIRRLVLRQLTWPVGAGMVLGTAAGVPAARLLAHAPFHLAALDAAAPAAALCVFSATAVAAALLPASRALRTDPLRALRYE